MDKQQRATSGHIDNLKQLAGIVGAGQALIGAAGGLAAFIRDHGGVDDILVEISALAIACYIALFSLYQRRC